jgi:N-acetylglucosamine-6-sulfatase
MRGGASDGSMTPRRGVPLFGALLLGLTLMAPFMAHSQTRDVPACNPTLSICLPAATGQTALNPPTPNIVLILVDDFSTDLMPNTNDSLAINMPNLASMQREGLTFDNYFVTDSLCCPSRASIFTGLLPHNSGVLTNGGDQGGYGAFMAHGDDAKTFAVELQKAQYQTAMTGKYLNEYNETSDGVPQGWNEWAVASNGYAGYGYTLNHNGLILNPPDHLTDTIALIGSEFINRVAPGPFFLELASFSPHAPFTPPLRYADAFPGVIYPKTPAFGARPDAKAPDWLKIIPPLKLAAYDNFNRAYRLRLQSSQGVDDMIGAVRQTLELAGLTQSTYVIFTSDNGFHMGEYSLRAGKRTPFDTDIKVPLIIVGPGIAAGRHIDDIAMNIDLFPTFVELAGLPPVPTVDGHSLVPLLFGLPGAIRKMAVVEHTHAVSTPGDPDAADPKAGDPPDYVALRLKKALYVEYLDGSGTVGFYDLRTDPYALHNVAGTLSRVRRAALHNIAVANHACVGAIECGAAQALEQ